MTTYVGTEIGCDAEAVWPPVSDACATAFA